MYLSAHIRSFILPKIEIVTVNHNWSRGRAQLIMECDTKKPTNPYQNEPVPQGSKNSSKDRPEDCKKQRYQEVCCKIVSPKVHL